MRSGASYDWKCHEYAEEVHSYLRKRELKCIPFRYRSPQIAYRRCLVEYLCSLCTQMEFCFQVKHLAIYMMDLVMDNYDIPLNTLPIMATGCLIVAVKVDEQDYLIPKTSVFNAVLGNAYNLEDFVSMEIMIMQFFKWNLLVPTVATFAEYYCLYSADESDTHDNSLLTSIEVTKNYCAQYVEFFVELTLLDVGFRKFESSMVAATCVAAARICLGLHPYWPPYIRAISNHGLEDFRGCLELLTKVLHREEAYNQVRILEQIPHCLAIEQSSPDSPVSSSSTCMSR